MSAFKKEDIRITKTDRVIIKSLTTLLEKRRFVQITIMDICKEALISRATFYAHFDDKYDLLKHWLINLTTELTPYENTYEKLAENINKYALCNKKTIKNITTNINEETLNLIYELILSDVIKLNKKDGLDAEYIISSSFCAGGMVAYIGWQIKNGFPAEIPMMNRFLYDMIRCIKKQKGD